MDRVILHSDCNNFFASVECLLHPELREKCVAVGGSEEARHGIILAKNEAAKKFGVKTAEPLWQARNKCPDLVIVPPHFSDYVRFSKATREIYCDFTDRVEPFGMDEAWLDVTGDDGMETAEKISNRIKSELGITVSIGVSFNKAFAKLGSDYKKPDAITHISRENYRDIVWKLPVEDLLFVGRATAEKLHKMGVRTIGELAEMPLKILQNHFGKNAYILHSYAAGEDTSRVARFGEVPAVKSISNSTTPPRDIVCRDDAMMVLHVLCESVGRRMREQGLKCKRVGVYMRTNELVSCMRQASLREYTDQTADVLDAAMDIIDSNHDWRMPLRSIGVNVTSFSTGETAEQVSFFSDIRDRIKQERLTAATDKLKDRYGVNCIVPATVLADPALNGFVAAPKYNPFGICSGEEI